MVFKENKDGRRFDNLKGTPHNKRTNIVKHSEETCSLILTPGAHQFIYRYLHADFTNHRVHQEVRV